MIRKLFVALAALLPANLQAQPAQHGQPLWSVAGDRHELVPARTSLPRTAGTLSMVQARDGRPDGTDSNLMYRSADGAVIATVYLYYPGLAHPGLAAYATDRGIRLNSRTPLESAPPRLADAGGVASAAIRIDYSNYMGANASSAGFIKAGRWMIKIRVTGPEARRAEVMTAMDALLAGIRFNPDSPARAAAPVAVTDCPSGPARPDANLIANEGFEQLTAHGLLALTDGAGVEGQGEDGRRISIASRIPASMCVSSRIGQANLPILRATGDVSGDQSGRTGAVVIISDAGTLIEIARSLTTAHYVLLHHEIGSTTVLGSFDAMPSDRQIIALFTERNNPATQARARVNLRANGDTELTLPEPPAAAPGT